MNPPGRGCRSGGPPFPLKSIKKVGNGHRLYAFPNESDFFPPLTLRSALAVTEGHMAAFHGFVTPVYFKNPGFAKGDKLTIKVRDANDASITGECEVVLM